MPFHLLVTKNRVSKEGLSNFLPSGEEKKGIFRNISGNIHDSYIKLQSSSLSEIVKFKGVLSPVGPTTTQLLS